MLPIAIGANIHWGYFFKWGKHVTATFLSVIDSVTQAGEYHNYATCMRSYQLMTDDSSVVNNKQYYNINLFIGDYKPIGTGV